jgi:hypothetical protein
MVGPMNNIDLFETSRLAKRAGSAVAGLIEIYKRAMQSSSFSILFLGFSVDLDRIGCRHTGAAICAAVMASAVSMSLLAIKMSAFRTFLMVGFFTAGLMMIICNGSLKNALKTSLFNKLVIGDEQ